MPSLRRRTFSPDGCESAIRASPSPAERRRPRRDFAARQTLRVRERDWQPAAKPEEDRKDKSRRGPPSARAHSVAKKATSCPEAWVGLPCRPFWISIEYSAGLRHEPQN